MCTLCADGLVQKQGPLVAHLLVHGAFRLVVLRCIEQLVQGTRSCVNS